MSHPPNNGPMTLASPNIAPKSPCQRPRSRGLKRSPTKAKALTIIAPPPIPCIARKIISWNIEVATPERTDPIRNTTMPAIKNGLRP